MQQGLRAREEDHQQQGRLRAGGRMLPMTTSGHCWVSRSAARRPGYSARVQARHPRGGRGGAHPAPLHEVHLVHITGRWPATAALAAAGLHSSATSFVAAAPAARSRLRTPLPQAPTGASSATPRRRTRRSKAGLAPRAGAATAARRRGLPRAV